MNGQSEGADSVLTDEIRRRLLKGTGTAAGAVAFYPLFSAGSAMAASNGSGVSGAQYVYVGTYTGALCQCGFGLRASGFGLRASGRGCRHMVFHPQNGTLEGPVHTINSPVPVDFAFNSVSG